MERYASIDFLRGFAIWMMLLLHVVMRIYDDHWALSFSTINPRPIINILILVILAFFGGWAGIFLIVSAIGNTISMQKAIKRGVKEETVLGKQLIVGFLLLIAAFLTESLTGYHGLIGDLVLGRNFKDWIIPDLFRAYHMSWISVHFLYFLSFRSQPAANK